MHDNVVKDVAGHDKIQVVLRRHCLVLGNSLLDILQHCCHVPLHFAFGDTVITDRTHLLHHARQCIPPVARIGVHGDGGDGAAFAEGVAVVDLHRCMVRAVPGDDSELQYSDENANSNEVADVLQVLQWSHRSLRVEVQLQALQQLIPEDSQGPVPWLLAAGGVEGGGLREGARRADHGNAEVVELLRAMPSNLPAEQRPGIRGLRSPDWIQGGDSGLRLVSGWGRFEDLLDASDHLILGHVPYDIEGRVAGVVPFVMECSKILLLPRLDLLFLANRELSSQFVGLMEAREGPGLDAVLHIVDLLHLRQHCLALLLDAEDIHLRHEGDLIQCLQRRLVHVPAVLQRQRGMDMINRMLEVGECVGTRSRTDELLALATTQEAYVLHHVSDALLMWLFIDAANMELDVGLETARRHSIPQQHVSQTVGEDASLNTGVLWQRPV
mmetsp:Transcript_11186/g.25051  ORF Transcript_11186/g.25051 Transcript_11186/m.25051 type:complete len:441 (+) Transcript_11186:2066-3388(+)